MLIDDYAVILKETIDTIRETQREKILQAAILVKEVIQKDGLIYVFGCGHSHMIAEETFYRAGGLACVAPVFCLQKIRFVSFRLRIFHQYALLGVHYNWGVSLCRRVLAVPVPKQRRTVHAGGDSVSV